MIDRCPPQVLHTMTRSLGVAFALLTASSLFGAPPAEPAADEARVAKSLEARGARLKRDDAGRVTQVFVGGKLTLDELRSIGELEHLERLAVNQPPAGNGEWEFLAELPNLNSLTIWHGHQFSSLESFNGLKVESLTLGGCMGLRDLNRDNPARQRDAVLSLRDLPNLRKLTLYHSPLTPGDEHLAHIVKEFPKLTFLRVDFDAPRRSRTTITPEGLAGLGKLPLERLEIEHAHEFTVEHVRAIAGLKTLKALHVHPRGSTIAAYEELLAPLAEARPDVTISFQQPPKPKS